MLPCTLYSSSVCSIRDCKIKPSSALIRLGPPSRAGCGLVQAEAQKKAEIEEGVHQQEQARHGDTTNMSGLMRQVGSRACLHLHFPRITLLHQLTAAPAPSIVTLHLTRWFVRVPSEEANGWTHDCFWMRMARGSFRILI